MIVVRCKVCGVSMKTLYTQKQKGYSETFSDNPCDQCTNQPKTIEQKLLKAIFGEA